MTLLESITNKMPVDWMKEDGEHLVFMEFEPTIEGAIREVPRLMDFIYLSMTVPDKGASEWAATLALYAWSKLLEIVKSDDPRHAVLVEIFDKVKRLYFSLAYNEAERFSQGINVIMAEYFEWR